MKKFLVLCSVLISVLVVLLNGCKSAKSEPVEILGAGATFPAPLYNKMFDEYYNLTKNKVNYQAIGSGGGIKQYKEKTVDFGGTDAYLSDKDIAEITAAGDSVLHIPTCIGAVVVAFNLPGITKIKLSPEVVSGIFLGTITKWDDALIVADNKDITLPAMDIKLVTRSDSSGTTFVFTDYLANVSKEWSEKFGADKSINWPAAGVLSGKGNPGVAGLITQMPGSLGYIELSYATQNGISYAALKNKSGNFIEPTLESASKAAAGSIPADTRISLVNSDVADAYSIASFTWLIFNKELNYGGRTEHQAKEIVKMLQWVITDGQQYNEALDYAKIPEATVVTAKQILKQVTFNGKTLSK